MKNEVSAVWDSACETLADALSKDVFDRWISVIHPVDIDDQTIHLKVANDFYFGWLEEHYMPLIKDAVRDAGGCAREIRFTVDSNTCVMLPREQERYKVKRGSGPRKTAAQKKPNLNPKYLFDNFIVGPSNHFAHAASLAVAQTPARAYNPLFIYGGVGLGKTHLMQAIGHYILNKNDRKNICYISSEAFINKYISALQRQKLVEFRKQFRNFDVLLIDDIQFLGGKERMQEEFFHTFNALFDNHNQIVLTCDRPASEIPGLTERLVSRFEWGQVTELEKPDIETRLAILKNKAIELNVNLPEPALNFLAENIKANIRRLEGALIRTASYASLTQRDIDDETLRHLLRDTLDQEQQDKVTIDAIKRTVAEYFDIRQADMNSSRRPKNIAVPRQVAMYLSRMLTEHSLPVIGEAFSKNHATVLHACKTIQANIAKDTQLRNSINHLQKKLAD